MRGPYSFGALVAVGWPQAFEVSRQSGSTLFRHRVDKALFTFGIDSPAHPTVSSAAGARFAWGHTDGSVTVCDITQVNRRLTVIGLGW